MQNPFFATTSWVFARYSSVSTGLSGSKIISGPWPFSHAIAVDSASQPLCRPMTSMMKTLVDVADIACVSRLASRMLVARYFAQDGNPGLKSVP